MPGEAMKEYDVIVVGSGAGMIIVNQALIHDAKVALIDRGPRLGGTCLNYGCIPSKMLIYPADRIMEVRRAAELGIRARVEEIDFNAVMDRMRKSRDDGEKQVRDDIKRIEDMDFYEAEAHFVEDYTLEVNGDKIKADRIFLVSGSRPVIPPIKGIDEVDYLTNQSVLELKERPESIIIIGGGYIGVEYAHFFDAVGTKVTIIEMADRLVLSEELELAGLLLEELRKRMTISLNTTVVEMKKVEGGVVVTTRDSGNGRLTEFSAKTVMIAIGRRSNADILKVENTGVELDGKGFIKVDKYFETSKKNIFAVGDANGEQMFTHVANREAALAIDNVLHDKMGTIDRNAVPHAVYSFPQIASVGMGEEAAKKEHRVLVGKTRYYDVAKGEAMMEKEGFAKAILEEKSEKILGFHIIGPCAPILIQEVANAMISGGHANEIFRGIHIHPALSELVPVTLNNILRYE
jgi:mycothione reductase